MKPTLLIGDYIFISKFSYGFSKYSFPLGFKFDYFEGRLGGDKPERGDIIVFRPPTDTRTDYIKRLIGMPGDSVQMIDGKLYLNGVKLKTKRIEDFVDQRGNKRVVMRRYVETLPNGKSYQILDERADTPSDDTPKYIVPDDHYFFMGDNRDNSADSRLLIGFVPEENLIGKAELILFSNESRFLKIWEWLFSFRDNRFMIPLDDQNK
jgi:signal peptidase I